MVFRGVVYIFTGIAVLGVALYIFVDTINFPHYLVLPLYDQVYDAEGALLGIFLIMWGLYTIRRDRAYSKSRD